MNLSLNFWVELVAIAVCFGVIITLIPKFRAYSINKAKAVALRVRVSETIKLSLPAVASTSIQTIDAMGQPLKDARALRFYSQQLEGQLLEAFVLYEDERERVQRFMDKYTRLIQAYESDTLGSDLTEDLLLLGERILVDLKENGLLSTIKS